MKSISIKKASILIWSIFLLLFLSTSFLYISTKIGNFIDSSEELVNSKVSKYDFLNGITSIENAITGEKYEYLTNSIYTGVLRNLETKTFTGIKQTINFTILAGGGSGTIYYSGNSSTGLTNTGFILNYTDTGSLTITNSGGFTNYNINLINTSYEIYNEILGKKIIKEKGEK